MPTSHTLNLFLANEDDTLQLGDRLAGIIRTAQTPLVFWLQGDLGAGKTTFTRGLLRSLGHQGAVKSPTYALAETYSFSDITVHHLDLYRFQSPEEWLDAGLDDLMTSQSLMLIEWPQQGGEFTPPADIQLALISADNGRQAKLCANTQTGKKILAQLKS